MPAKPKTPQPKDNSQRQERDYFQTPAYATDLIVPFLPRTGFIWEPACGEGAIVTRLLEQGFSRIEATDKFHNGAMWQTGPGGVREEVPSVDFLMAPLPCVVGGIVAIITNPPYSLKEQFARRCMEHRLPWALLIPADFNLWLCEAIGEWGCRIVMPKRRIDYITPNGKSGKESAAQFHSMWLTWGLPVPCQLHVVELTNETKRGIKNPCGDLLADA